MKLFEIVEKLSNAKKQLDFLYSITDDQLEAFETTREEIDSMIEKCLSMENLSKDDFEKKANSIAWYIKECENEAEFLKKRKQEIEHRQKQCEKRAESLRVFLENAFIAAGITEIKSDFVMKFQKQQPKLFMDNAIEKIIDRFLITDVNVSIDIDNLEKAFNDNLSFDKFTDKQHAIETVKRVLRDWSKKDVEIKLDRNKLKNDISKNDFEFYGLKVDREADKLKIK